MRRSLPLFLVVLAILITAGCIEPETPPVNDTNTTGPPPVTSRNPADDPGRTPAPEAVAYLSGIACSVGDRSEAAYHCNGNIRIRGGAAAEARVIARYPDNNTFRSTTVDLGGTEPIQKSFVIFPDIRYQGQTPAYAVRLNGTEYPVVMSGSGGGTAWTSVP